MWKHKPHETTVPVLHPISHHSGHAGQIGQILTSLRFVPSLWPIHGLRPLLVALSLDPGPGTFSKLWTVCASGLTRRSHTQKFSMWGSLGLILTLKVTEIKRCVALDGSLPKVQCRDCLYWEQTQTDRPTDRQSDRQSDSRQRQTDRENKKGGWGVGEGEWNKERKTWLKKEKEKKVNATLDSAF